MNMDLRMWEHGNARWLAGYWRGGVTGVLVGVILTCIVVWVTR